MKKSPSKVKKVSELFDDVDNLNPSPKSKSPKHKASSDSPASRPYISQLDYANFLYGKPYETKVSYLQFDKGTGAKEPPHKPVWKIQEEQRGPPPLLYPIFPKEIGARLGKSKILFKFYTDTPRIQTPLGRIHIPRTHQILRKEMNRSTPEFKAASSRPAFVQAEESNRPLLLAETVWALERQKAPVQRPSTDSIMEKLHALDTGHGPQPVVVPRSEQMSEAVRTLRIEAAKAKQNHAPATLNMEDYDRMIQTVKQGSLLAANGNLAGLRHKFNEIQLNTMTNSRPDLIPTHLRPRSAATVLQSPMRGTSTARSSEGSDDDYPGTTGATVRTFRPHSAAAGPNGVASSLLPPPLPGGLPHIPLCSIPRPDKQPPNPPTIELRPITASSSLSPTAHTKVDNISGGNGNVSTLPVNQTARPGSATVRPGSARSPVPVKKPFPSSNSRGHRPSSAAVVHLDPDITTVSSSSLAPINGTLPTSSTSLRKENSTVPQSLHHTVTVPSLNFANLPPTGTDPSPSSDPHQNPNPFPSFTPSTPLRRTASRGHAKPSSLLFSPLVIQGQKVNL